MKFKPVTAIMLSALIIFAITSCDQEPVDDRPELPPIESLQMDFSAFVESPAGNKGMVNTYNNFVYSYLTVGFWNLYAGVVSALPVIAYSHALHQTPVYLGDYTWEWSFEFGDTTNVLTKNYIVALTGTRIDNEEFSMEMIIASSQAPNQGVKWFDGIVRYDHTHALWTIYDEGSTSVLEIEWNKDFVTEEADLTYTYSETGQTETGSYIQLAYLPDAVYDAAYTISLAAGMTNIEWNTTTIEGRVMAPVHFGDDAWHCWDTKTNNFADIICD